MSRNDRGRRSAAARVGALPATRAWRDPAGIAWPEFAAWPDRLRALARAEIDNRRLFPWLAVAFGLGILLGFAADPVPSPWPGLVGAGVSAAAAWSLRARVGPAFACVALAAVFAGFTATSLRLRAAETPLLQRLAVAKGAGFVETMEERSTGGARVVLRLTGLDGLPEAERPLRVRVTVRSLGGLAPGDHVAGTFRLLPLPEAVRPGGFDFARDAWFRGLGAVGSVSGRLTRTAAPATGPDPGLRWAAAIDGARNALTTRIAGTIGGQAGAVAAALITGKRGLIDERTNDVLRAAGIYHVVSISGLHMVLAAGTFFWLARAVLALSTTCALALPIKKIAAVCGMAGATVYCIFSGAEVATERALVMILVMQGAILFDRPALSLRNLALSALIVLAREPEALLGPSFQMSYAAVLGLIALAEALRARRPTAERGDPLKRIGWTLAAFVGGIVGTTLVASLATGPFGAYHFQTLQPYGLLGNAATLPLVSLAVMPAAVLGVLALPFGLDRPVWSAMGWAVEGVLRLSEWVAGFAGATVVVPAFGSGILLLLVAALLLATLPGYPLRLTALVPLGAAVALLATPAQRPDILVARDGAGAAVRGPEGRLVVLGRPSAFTVEQWLRADGDGRKATDPTLRAGVRCDRLGCTAATVEGRTVSHVSDRRAFAEDCGRADIILSRLHAPPSCASGIVVDRAVLARQGATALVKAGEGYSAGAVRDPGRPLPWHVRQVSPTQAASRPTSRPALPSVRTPPAGNEAPEASSDPTLPDAEELP